MIQGLSLLVKRLGKGLLLLGLLAIPFSFAAAQEDGHRPKSITAQRDDDEKGPFTAIDEELKAKRAIKFADKEYQDNLNRARDLSSLSTAVVTSYKEKSRLDSEEIKKLEKIEKLAKAIRNAAGGSEGDTHMENPPKDLSAAVAMLSDLSQSLRAKVEKTPKHVISAAAIDQANVLLELVRIVRTLPS
jgi:hypothetical protein